MKYQCKIEMRKIKSSDNKYNPKWQWMILKLIIIIFIDTKQHITIGKIIKYRRLDVMLANNLFGTFESSP